MLFSSLSDERSQVFTKLFAQGGGDVLFDKYCNFLHFCALHLTYCVSWTVE